MEFFVDNFYEFSDVRQSKYSSFMMIYELYKAHGMCKVCLQLNVLDEVTVVGLKCQSCRDKKLSDIKKQFQSIKIVDDLMHDKVETNNDTILDEFMMIKDSNNNTLDSTKPKKTKFNPYLNFNMEDIVSFSPTVIIEKLDNEFITTFLRKNNSKKIKKITVKSKAIKKKCVKKPNTRKGNNLLKSLIHYVDK